jgi:hypothetical protein
MAIATSIKSNTSSTSWKCYSSCCFKKQNYFGSNGSLRKWIMHFGENKMRNDVEQMPKDIQWHMIGHVNPISEIYGSICTAYSWWMTLNY